MRPILEVYDRPSIKGSLLILGTPGAGKTTTLLSLAQQLIGRELANLQQGSPKTVIPLIFELSTWRDDQQSIGDWLVAQLYENYGGDRKSRVYEIWLEQQVLLPLLDGLDELGLGRQQKCTEQLNQFAQTYPQMVVCCRVKEFRQVGVKLSNLRGAVQLEPLSDRQIQSYLAAVGKSALWEQIQTVPEMHNLLQPVVDPENPDYDEPGLLRVPLFISLAARVFEADRPLKGKADLFDRYIDRQLDIETRQHDRYRKELNNRQWSFQEISKEPKYNQVKHSLSWMAVQLQKQHQVELLLEKIQPIHLEQKVSEKYQLICGTFCGVIWGAILGFYSLPAFIFFVICIGCLGAIFSSIPIRPVEVIKISVWPRNINNRISRIVNFAAEIFEKYRDEENFPAFLTFHVLLLTTFILTLTFCFAIAKESTSSIFSAVLAFALLWLLKEFIAGFHSNLKIHLYLNQGIMNSFKSMLIIAFSTALTGISLALFSSLFWIFLAKMIGITPIELVAEQELLRFLNILPQSFLAIIVVLGLPLGFLFGGGFACIQYLSLRIVLTRHHKIPWNLARFLTYCHERRLLQQIGGRYRFIHRELLDHFARIEN